MIDFHYSYNWKYPICSLKNLFEDLRRDIKSFFQRGIRGYADKDVWSFDHYLSNIIYNGLNRLQTIKHGFPCGLDENSEKDEEKWDRTLQTMIDGFEAANEVCEDSFIDKCCSKTETENFLGIEVPKLDIDKYEKECNIRKEKLSKAMDLFKKYFFDLWD